MRAFPGGFADGTTQAAVVEKYARCNATGYPWANFWSDRAWNHSANVSVADPGTVFLGGRCLHRGEPTFQVRPRWEYGDCNPRPAAHRSTRAQSPRPKGACAG